MNTSTKDHGTFSWSELMTNDFDGSMAFYRELFGWILREVPGRGDTRYALILNESAPEPFGGILSMPQSQAERGVPTHWQTYVTVDNIEETIAKAERLGGQVVVPPMPVERVGTVAVIRDPQGAVVSVVKYDQ